MLLKILPSCPIIIGGAKRSVGAFYLVLFLYHLNGIPWYIFSSLSSSSAASYHCSGRSLVVRHVAKKPVGGSVNLIVIVIIVIVIVDQ